ncbi:S41 family peptidase [soil metagenome]
MKLVCSLAATLLVTLPGPVIGQPAVPSFAEPGISPDGLEIAFASGGDIWTVPAGGGEARLLVSHPATESRPLYSPDGRHLAFVSTRTGNGDVYLLTFASGELQRLTFDDGLDQLDGWSPDSRWIYFSSTSRDIAGMNDVFRVPLEGGTPMPVSADRYTNEFFSAPAPDGQTLAISARGIASGQWWRRGSSHIDQSEIWLVRGGGATPRYERFSEGAGKEKWPMWSPDGRTLFYVSDRGGAQNVWMRPLGGQPQQLTRFTEGRVLWPSLSRDGRTIVFERGLRLWALDTASGQARELPVTLRGAPAGTAPERLSLSSGFQELALSPDGQKVALVVRGEVFATSAKDGGEATRITSTPAAESQIVWAPDSRRLAYVSARSGTPQLFLYDFATREETQLTQGSGTDHSPRFSPDGRSLAFVRGGRELRVLELGTRRERVLATGYLDVPPLLSERALVWSPDGQWIAYLATGERLFTNAHIVPAAGGASRPVSFLANVSASTISWSPDSTFLLFNTGQRTEVGQIARVDLVPRTPRFREDQFRDLFRQETPQVVTPQPNPPASPSPRELAPQRTDTMAAPAPDTLPRAPGRAGRIEWEGFRQRLSLLPIGVDVGSQTISPDGKWLLMIGSSAGQDNLYLYSLDELAREEPVARQLTSTPGNKRAAQFSPDSKEVYYLDAGRIQIVPIESRQPRPLAVTAEMEVDFAEEKHEVFRQTWSYLSDHFYDPGFHGVNWSAMRAEYAPHVAGARTPDELRRILSLMVGELNASHLGVNAPGGTLQPSTGRLGLRFDPAEYERAGRLRVTEVIALSPAAVTGQIRPGDYLLAVDGTPITARTNLDELLAFKINRRVELTVAGSPEGRGRREVAVRPVNAQTEKGLLYRQWVNENREYVARVSNGRLGYVHMPDMSWNSLQQLYVDLDAENYGREGVVVDLRNNNGGFVNVYAIDVLARREYLRMTPRGFPAAPARTVLGQRSLGAPTILVTNRHSLSDAEDFTEGYRAHGLGQVVGEPTAGWIIYTWNTQLIDGSVVRLPRMRVDAMDGTNMELNPRPVDVPVQRPVGESYTGRDSELDTAVRELLRQIDTRAGERRAGG